MRQLILADLLTATRALAASPAEARAKLAAQWLAEAHSADKFTKRRRYPHPQWGNGTLAARVIADENHEHTAFDLSNLSVIDALAHIALALYARRSSLALPPKRPMC